MNKTLEKIYHSSPFFLQNLWVSLFGLKLQWERFGPKFEKALQEFEKKEFWSWEQIKEYQNEKLRLLIQHSYEKVPYYRNIMNKIKLKPDDIKTIEDLPKLPILTRNDIKQNFDNLRAQNFIRKKLKLGYTSGTTGSPLQFYWDKNICLINNAMDWRQKKWAGDRSPSPPERGPHLTSVPSPR